MWVSVILSIRVVASCATFSTHGPLTCAGCDFTAVFAGKARHSQGLFTEE